MQVSSPRGSTPRNGKETRSVRDQCAFNGERCGLPGCGVLRSVNGGLEGLSRNHDKDSTGLDAGATSIVQQSASTGLLEVSWSKEWVIWVRGAQFQAEVVFLIQ